MSDLLSVWDEIIVMCGEDVMVCVYGVDVCDVSVWMLVMCCVY